MNISKTKLLVFAFVSGIFLVLLASNKESEIENVYPPISPLTTHSFSDANDVKTNLDISVSAIVSNLELDYRVISVNSHPANRIYDRGQTFIIRYSKKLIPRPRDDVIPIS